LLAAHGFATLALAYFGTDGVPQELERLPLEYFEHALRFLAAHPRVRGDRLAIGGASFGAQAALLVGATFPEVRAVVSVVGSGVIKQGIVKADFLDIMRRDIIPWTRRGEPLPFVANTVTPELEKQVENGDPVEMIFSFLPGLEDEARVAARRSRWSGSRGRSCSSPQETTGAGRANGSARSQNEGWRPMATRTRSAMCATQEQVT
jgi:pimeloyl-ACP methyl ester carboxylesterase